MGAVIHHRYEDREKEVRNLVRLYNHEVKPYKDALVKIQQYKLPRMIYNPCTEHAEIDFGPDEEIEVQIKEHITWIRDKYDKLMKEL